MNKKKQLLFELAATGKIKSEKNLNNSRLPYFNQRTKRLKQYVECLDSTKKSERKFQSQHASTDFDLIQPTNHGKVCTIE